MESDLPLMEDDSLIQQFPDPNQTPSKSSVNYFNCSHFKLPPSHTKSLKGGVHLEKPSSSSSKTSNNKENINSNNVEVPKLGMGPMQMKRKQKGGGYNLRKSLAWDRAFFTDEGILDPLELTLITGINANTCGGGLHTISEEGDSSFSSDTRCTKGPKDKETSEEDPHKELQDKSRTSMVKGEKTGCSVGNHNSSPHRKVTHKFLSTDRTNRAGSKVGVPEPLAASSLKRPANSSTLKTAKKESKLPKLPISKPGSFYSATTKGSTTASQLRHNLFPKPTISVEKNVALKSSVKNVHGSQSKAKMGSGSLRLPIKEPAKKTVRNLTNSSSKGTSSTKSRLVQVDRANSGSEVVPDIQERSAPPAAKNQAQNITPSLNNSLPEVAKLTSSGPCHIERASNGLVISDRLHPSANQEHCATLASSHHMNLHNTGMYPPNTEPARPSGLRLPSPSLRFFDQKTALESDSLQQKKIQLHNTNMGSNRKIGELRPPVAPARTPMKSNDVVENVCSMVPTSSGRCLPPSILSTHCGSSPLIPLPIYLRSTTKGVPDSDIYPNLERKIMQKEDIKMQYDSRGSEVQIHKAIEQEKRTIGHDGNMKMEKFARNNDEEIMANHLTKKLGEGIGANIHLVGNDVNNKVGAENQVISQGNDEKVFLPETKGRFVLHNEEDRLQNYTAISMSTSGQSIQHQEQNILTADDGNTGFMQDLAQTSGEQVDTEKSDASNVNPESHLDVDSLEAEGQVRKVFAEPQKDRIGKSENDAGPTKGVGSGSQNCSVVMQHINTKQENDVAKVVDDLYKSSHMEDDAGCSADSPCNETKGRIIIISRESLKDEARNGENTDAREMEGTVTMLNTSSIPFQNMDTEQGNDDADNVSVFPTRLSIRDAGKLVLHDHSSAEGFYINPSTSIENKVQLQDSPERDAVMLVQHDNPSAESFHINKSTSFKDKAQLQDSPVRDGTANQSAKCFETTIACVSALLNSEFNSEGWSVNRIMPAESSNLEDGPCDNVTEINDHFFQEKGRSNYSKAILMKVLDQKQDGVDVALIPGKLFEEARLGYKKVAPLIDDNNHSSLSCLRPEVGLISGTASVDDDAFCKTESVLKVAECASTYPQSWEKEGLNLAAAVTNEAEFKIDEENQKSQEMGIIIRSLSRKSILAEESQHSCGNMEANATIQGCTDGSETYNEFQSENKTTLEGLETFNNFPKPHLEDAQMQLLDGDILVRSCSSLTSVLHNHSIQNVDHSDIFEEQPEFSDDGMELEKDLISNHQLLPTTEECVCKGVVNVVDQSDVYECDRKPSNTTVHSPPARQAVGLHHNNNGQLFVEYGTSGSTEIDQIAEHNENYSDTQFTYNTECSDLALLSELKSSGNDEMESREESCSFPRKVADSMQEEKATLFGEFGQFSADSKQMWMESLSPEKNPNLDKPNNALDIVIGLPEQSISHGCDCDLQNSNASAFLPTMQGNVSDLNGEDQPNEPQAFDVIMPSQEKCDYVTNERSGNGLEFSGQDPSESNSNLPVSQDTTTDGKFTSTAFCSVTVESCSAAGGDKSLRTSTCRIGAEEPKISFEEEVETEALQEGKHPMVAEFNHEMNGEIDLKHNKDATLLTKRSNNIKKHDNSLVIHPPNAVPFSDEWLAAIEAAGEEILTMKHGAVQHSPPDKCLPEPSPWSPVKKKGNQIGPYDCTKYTNAMPSSLH